MHKFLWIVFIFSLNGSTCFGLSLVHHQGQHLISCTVQLVHAGTNCTVQLIKCCPWWWTNDSPKHVEPFNEKMKTIHKNLCIAFVYIHIAIWCTVYTMSDIKCTLYHFRSRRLTQLANIGDICEWSLQRVSSSEMLTVIISMEITQ